MAMTFDATLKDMGRESPKGFLETFDRPAAKLEPLSRIYPESLALAFGIDHDHGNWGHPEHRGHASNHSLLLPA